jgi:hypothetical protein
MRSATLYFDEDQLLAVVGHNVDLTTAETDVPIDNCPAPPAEIADRPGFAKRSESATCHAKEATG